MRSLRLTHVLALTSLLALSACNEDPTDIDEDPEQFVWEVQNIQPYSTTTLTFAADGYLVAAGGLVDTGIRISGSESGTEFGWLIRGGECGSGGPLLTSDPSAFPLITIGDDGKGAVAKAVFGYLDGSEQFYMEVYADPRATLELVGCGNMEKIEGLPMF